MSSVRDNQLKIIKYTHLILMIVLRHDGDSEGHITGRHSEDPRA
jgi:hypothetical protein